MKIVFHILRSRVCQDLQPRAPLLYLFQVTSSQCHCSNASTNKFSKDEDEEDAEEQNVMVVAVLAAALLVPGLLCNHADWSSRGRSRCRVEGHCE